MQAEHGGDLAAFCRRFGIREDEALDFSSNLNWFLPPIDDDSWMRWKAAVSCYGDPSSAEVSRKLAGLFGYPESQVLATAGSIEAIYLVSQLFRKKRIAIGVPGFADFFRAFERSDKRLWNLSIDDTSLEWAEVILYGSPNNPTGTRYPLDEWRRRWPGRIWLVDETFVEFSGQPPSEPATDVILFRSLTKSWSIPGLRLGFLLTSNQQWMRQLESLQPPWSVSAIAQAWAEESLNADRKNRVEESIRTQLRERERLMAELGTIEALRVHSSDASFFLLELPGGGANALWERLAGEGMFTRKGDSFEGLRSDAFLRIAVRQRDENRRLVEAIRGYFSAK